MNNKNVIAIIPARMAATRFPGKPMKPLLGMPMIEHIWRRCLMCDSFNEVYVATCDDEIFKHITSLGGKAVMTLDTHERCTDRTTEALLKIEKNHGEKFDVIAMIQGDEPLVSPIVLNDAVMLMKKEVAPIVNLTGPITSEEEFQSPNIVKVVEDKNGFAMYFSRQPIPTVRAGVEAKRMRQTGLIFFERNFLLKFNELPQMVCEKSESVDMMRVLEHGHKINLVFADVPCLTIDVPEDISPVEEALKDDSFYLTYRADS